MTSSCSFPLFKYLCNICILQFLYITCMWRMCGRLQTLSVWTSPDTVSLSNLQSTPFTLQSLSPPQPNLHPLEIDNKFRPTVMSSVRNTHRLTIVRLYISFAKCSRPLLCFTSSPSSTCELIHRVHP